MSPINTKSFYINNELSLFITDDISNIVIEYLHNGPFVYTDIIEACVYDDIKTFKKLYKYRQIKIESEFISYLMDLSIQFGSMKILEYILEEHGWLINHKTIGPISDEYINFLIDKCTEQQLFSILGDKKFENIEKIFNEADNKLRTIFGGDYLFGRFSTSWLKNLSYYKLLQIIKKEKQQNHLKYYYENHLGNNKIREMILCYYLNINSDNDPFYWTKYPGLESFDIKYNKTLNMIEYNGINIKLVDNCIDINVEINGVPHNYGVCLITYPLTNIIVKESGKDITAIGSAVGNEKRSLNNEEKVLCKLFSIKY